MTRSTAKRSNANARKLARAIDRAALQDWCWTENCRFAHDSVRGLVRGYVRFREVSDADVNWPYVAELFNAKERGERRPQYRYPGRVEVGVPPEYRAPAERATSPRDRIAEQFRSW